MFEGTATLGSVCCYSTQAPNIFPSSYIELIQRVDFTFVLFTASAYEYMPLFSVYDLDDGHETIQDFPLVHMHGTFSK